MTVTQATVLSSLGVLSWTNNPRKGMNVWPTRSGLLKNNTPCSDTEHLHIYRWRMISPGAH